MSLLTIVQGACDSLLNALPPKYAAGNADDSVRQMVSLLNEEGREQAFGYPWQALTRRVEKPALPQEDQGDIESLAPGYAYILNDTIWLGGMPFKPLGPQNPQAVTGMEAFGFSPATTYWIEGNHLFVKRVPSASQRLMFRYQSRNWVKAADGTEKGMMTLDDDKPLIPERVLLLALVWRWLQRNGMPYEQEYMNYRNALQQYTSREGTRAVLNVSAGTSGYSPSQSILGGVMRV